MLLSHDLLVSDIVNKNVITKTDGSPIDLDQVNGASIDIRLGTEISIETQGTPLNPLKMVIDLSEKETLNMRDITIDEEGFHLLPGQAILASTEEKFNLPDDIAAEYVLKSSLARSFMQHMLAGFCDPWWTNSHLTLEIKNVSQFHTLVLKPGMKIGQMKFFKVNPVPRENGYAVKGQYNHSNGVVQSGGLR